MNKPLAQLLNKIHQADCLTFLKNLPDNSIDLLVTDPPYGYSFMGNSWDTFNEIKNPQGSFEKQKGFKKLPRNKPTFMYENFVPVWKESLRVLKPGAFTFVMSAPRQDTLLEQIRAIKDAGFKTDFTSIYWTYASGFPKASNISKMVDKRFNATREVVAKQKMTIGIGGNSKRIGGEKIIDKSATDLSKALDGSYAGFQPKPAVEIIIVAMKPLSEKTHLDQAIKNGKGVTWLDNCRLPYSSNEKAPKEWSGYSSGYGITKTNKEYRGHASTQGRFPANLLVSDDVLNNTNNKSANSKSFSRYFNLDKWEAPKEIKKTFPFLIVPKPSKAEKNHGCESLPVKQSVGGGGSSGAHGSVKAPANNFHPTVKPIKLMSYLITLGSRKNDIVLDPFAGSGTTCIAARQLGRRFIGIEKEEKYCQIAQCRLKATNKPAKKAA